MTQVADTNRHIQTSNVTG